MQSVLKHQGTLKLHSSGENSLKYFEIKFTYFYWNFKHKFKLYHCGATFKHLPIIQHIFIHRIYISLFYLQGGDPRPPPLPFLSLIRAHHISPFSPELKF